MNTVKYTMSHTENIDIETIKEKCEFGENRAYILIAVARSKLNEEITNNSQITYRKVITNEKSIEETIPDLWALMNQHDLRWRIYLTVNARNTIDGYFNFREEMNSWVRDLMNGDENTKEKFGKVSSYWKSALHNPKSSEDQYFQFDLDNIDNQECQTFIESLPAQDGSTVEDASDSVFKYVQKTPNGFHVITEPFNYTVFESPIEYDDLDTDGQVFIAEFDNQ